MNKKYHYAEDDIANAFNEIGLKKGDNVFIHSNLGFFGTLKNAKYPHNYYHAFKNEILNIIGDGGTLITPTFSYSYCHDEIFIPESTPGVGGYFSDMIMKETKAIRSVDGNFSIVAIGNLAGFFTKYPPEHSFGKNSFWERFLKSNGKFVNLNFDAGSTFIHYVEKTLNVPYRFDKIFSGSSMINGKKITGVFYHFVYDLSKPNNAPDFTKFDNKTKETGLAKRVNLGKGQIVSITAQDTFNLIKSELQSNPSFLIKGKLIQYENRIR
jgi:aminoglycoside 3-N-acetyltransferase